MKRKRNNKKITMIFVLSFLILFILSGFFMFMAMNGSKEYKEGTDAYTSIQQIAINDIESDRKSRIDFESLKEINSDVVGWLTLDDTVIDYPVVKGEDNDYYLHHLYTGEWNSLGTLFVDYRNDDLFNDQISVIYGHSMLNGSMFFILERYKKQSFYEDHKEFTFETPDQTYILEPIAGKVMDAKIPFLQLNFNEEEEYEDYIKEFIQTSTFKSDSSFSKKDKVVMMIKCSADYEDARYVLVCKVNE